MENVRGFMNSRVQDRVCYAKEGRFFVAVELKGRKVKALLDTGASISLVNKEIANYLTDMGELVSHCHNKNVEVADGRIVPLDPPICTSVKIGSFEWASKLYVLSGMPCEILLGADFFFACGPTIRFGNEKLLIFADGTKVPVMTLGENPPQRGLAVNNDVGNIEVSDETTKFLERELTLFQSVPGRTDVIRHRIDTGDAVPVKQRYYPVSPKIQGEINAQVDEMLRDGVIEPSKSPWSSPVILVPKKDGSRRFVVDFRKVNSLSRKDAYPLPYIATILDRLKGAKWVSTLDLEKGYWQVEMEPGSRDKTAFTVPGKGLFQFRVMPFGLHSAGATFQRLMDTVIGAELEPYCFTYLDDIIIVSDTYEDHQEMLHRVFSLLRKAGLKINYQKCSFFKEKLKFLGYIVGNGKLEADPERIESVRGYPTPKNASELKRFLGFVGWYRRFIPNFASVAEPLTSLLRKRSSWLWKTAQAAAFSKLKDCLTKAPILSCPDFNLPFIIQCDASEVGVGAVLCQETTSGENVIAYASRTLNPAERNYSVTERECLAVLFAIIKFKAYVEGYRFEVITDHASLVWLLSSKNPKGRLARWVVQLQQYNFGITHRRGKSNVVPDALSRIYFIGTPEWEGKKVVDPWYLELYKNVEDQPESNPDFVIFDGRLYYHGHQKVETGARAKLVVPLESRKTLLIENHDKPHAGHLGFYKTYNRMRRFYFWPTLRKDVEKYVRGCETCQVFKTERRKGAGEMRAKKDLTPPWTMVATDIIGPLPRSKSGNKYVLVFLDTSTRWPIAIPLRSVRAEDVAKQLLSSVINHWGCPEILLCDNGPQFRSRILQRACEAYGIQLAHIAPYHPRANPTERSIQTLKSMIAMYCRGAQRTWDEGIPHFMFALRTAKQETTGFSPAVLNLGRELRGPNEPFRVLSDSKGTPFEPSAYHKELKGRLSRYYESAETAMRKASERQARYFNLRRRDVEYEIGTLVWKRNHVLSDASKFRAEKLEPKFEGPYRVTGKVSSTIYRLESLRKKNVYTVHVEDLRPVL